MDYCIIKRINKKLFMRSKNIKIGDQVLVTCIKHTKYTNKIMFCIGLTKDKFIQLSMDKNAVIADIYLGKKQCLKIIDKV